MSKKNILKKSIETVDKMNYTVQLKTSKERIRYIKSIERIVRGSIEYKDYIQFLRENVDMTKCSFFNNVENGPDSRKVKIEIHHDPLTLFNITDTVLNKFITEGIPLNDLYIADEVMECHYLNRVGLIPLSKTIHEMVHKSDKIFIPLHLVYGRYKEFFDTYGEYMSDQLFELLEKKIIQTKAIKEDSFKALDVKYVYLEVEGFTLPQKIEVEERKMA